MTGLKKWSLNMEEYKVLYICLLQTQVQIQNTIMQKIMRIAILGQRSLTMM